MDIIRYEDFAKTRTERETHIKQLKQTLPQYLTIDEKLKVIVDPEQEKGVKELHNQINQLKHQNHADELKLKKIKELVIKYSLPTDKGKLAGAPYEALDIERIDRTALEHKAETIQAAQKRVANSHMSGVEFQKKTDEAEAEYQAFSARITAFKTEYETYCEQRI
jgi:hypothetical protein